MPSQPILKIDSLTVVLPVFNEEKIIEKSLRFLADTLQSVCLDYEILVVDDGSTDKTGTILHDLSHTIHGLRVLRHSRNQGLGGALQLGFREARKTLVFYTDSDMPFKYSDISQAVRAMESSGVDIIAGFRKNRAQEGVLRRMCSRAYNFSVACIYGVRAHDINCAFKLIRSDVLKTVVLKARGSFIDAEFIIKANYLGFKIQELGVEYYPREDDVSRLFRFYPIINGFLEMAKLYTDIMRVKRSAVKDWSVA